MDCVHFFISFFSLHSSYISQRWWILFVNIFNLSTYHKWRRMISTNNIDGYIFIRLIIIILWEIKIHCPNTKNVFTPSRCVLPLEERTKEGYTVLMCRLLDTDPSNYVYFDHMRYVCMCLDLWMYQEGTTNGHVIIFDTAGSTFGHAIKMSMSGAKKFLHYVQEGLPIRLKSLHMINTNSIMETMLNMMKPFMKKELVNMVMMKFGHNNNSLVST